LAGIRLRYSGLVAFVTRGLSLLTGFAFTLIVTNRLSEQDFGIWQLVQNSYSYTLILASVVTYWTIGSSARGEQSGKTSMALALLLSVPACAIYLTASIYYSTNLHVDVLYFLIGALQIPIMFLVFSSEAIAGGIRPQIQSYAFIAAELVKIGLAIPFLVISNMGLQAVLIIVILTQAAQLFVLVYLNSDQLRAGLNRRLAGYWLRLSWLPMVSAIPGFMATFDVALVTSLSRSVEVVAFYKAAFLLANFVTYGQYIAVALYPKILQGGTSRDIESVLQLILMLVIPLTVGIFLMSEPLLHLVKSSYTDSYLALLILIPASFSLVLYLFFDPIIGGRDHVEKDGSASFKNLVQSKLFLVAKIGMAYSVSYMAILSVLMLAIGNNFSSAPSTIAMIWAIAYLISIVPFTIYKGFIARSILHFSLPLRSLAKYLGAALVMAVALFFMNGILLNSGLPKVEYAFRIMAETAIGAGTYFAILYAIDSEFKRLLQAIFGTLFKANL